LTSCQNEIQQVDAESTELDNKSQYYHRRYKIYTLEGCEYIVGNEGTNQWGSHKGNCKNPIHTWNKK
jgi:hypothetical protein